jgi:hypothetical protein
MAIQSVKTVINGVEHSLTYNEASGKWEASLTAPGGSSYPLAGGYYNVAVTATDSAGNSRTLDAADSVLGASLRLFVKEKQPPVIGIVSPGAAAYVVTNMPQIVFELRDNTIGGNGDSGIKLDTLALKIDGGAAIGPAAAGMVCTPVTGGYDCTYTPQSALADGAHTVTVDVQDNDGNAAVQKSRGFVVDTVAPTLNVTSPADGLETNDPAITVEGSTNDATSSPVTITITLNGVDAGAVAVDGSGHFAHPVTLSEGGNTIVVRAEDTAGKYTEITRTVEVKTSLPEFVSVTIVPNPADAGQTYLISVEVTDAAEGA